MLGADSTTSLQQQINSVTQDLHNKQAQLACFGDVYEGQIHPAGTIPESDFANNDFTGLKAGIITRVDELHLKADVKVISGSEVRFELDLIQPMAGPSSFFGGIPEVGSVVVIGYRKNQ